MKNGQFEVSTGVEYSHRLRRKKSYNYFEKKQEVQIRLEMKRKMHMK